MSGQFFTLDDLQEIEAAHDAAVRAQARVTLLGTLRFLTGGWLESADDTEWLRGVVRQLVNEPDWTQPSMCPLCQHDPCQTGCPVAPLRGKR